MASIEKRQDASGKIKYRARVRIKGYPQETASFESLTLAKRWAQGKESEMREGRYFLPPLSKKKTMSEAIERYRKEKLPSLKDPSHRLNHLAWWNDAIGQKVLAEVNTALIIENREKLKNTPSTFGKHKGNARSDSTINRYIATISALFSTAVNEWHWLDKNPCKNIKKSKEPRGRVRFLSSDERVSLLKACESKEITPELKVIVLIAMTTGARKSEISHMKWRNVDLKLNRLIFEDTKNGETRSVPLVSVALDAIVDWSKVRSIDPDSYVFPGKTEKTNQKPLDFEKYWHTALKKSNVKDFRFHDLRHTAASYLAMNGAGIREIGDILGHKSLAMVQRYSHLCEDHKRATVQRMATAIFGSEL